MAVRFATNRAEVDPMNFVTAVVIGRIQVSESVLTLLLAENFVILYSLFF